MTSGGARPRSGPAPIPGSGRSDQRGLEFKRLPATGYDGEIPEFPRPVLHGAELSHWNAAWRTPQAVLWATPQYSFVIPTVALYCSLMAWSETDEYPVGIIGQIRGLSGEILLTPESLKREGYVIAADEVATKRDEPAARRGGARERHLEAVGDGQ